MGIEVLRGAAAQERVGECDVGTGRDGQFGDLERGPACLPFEERRPRVPVGDDAADAVFGWRHVEHDDVVGVVGEHNIEVAVVDGVGPFPDETRDAGFVWCHQLPPGWIDQVSTGRPGRPLRLIAGTG
ncbi:MAG: hypothetical protein QOI16_792 [Pseudonocardiales bacterium]|nr:hypothetical protein [Pseudonocardiales bacterium]